MGNKITGMNVRTEVTGLVEVVAYVEGTKNPYTMHVMVTGLDTNWPDYSVTTDMGLALTRTSKWDIERKLEGSEFQKMAMAMFDTAYAMIEANKPEPVKEEPVTEETQE